MILRIRLKAGRFVSRNQEEGLFVFSSDTGFTKSFGSFSKDVDLLVLECSFVKDKPTDGHIELEEAIYLARYSRAGKTILTHLYPEWDDVDFEKEVKRLTETNDVVAAFDGMQIEV